MSKKHHPYYELSDEDYKKLDDYEKAFVDILTGNDWLAKELEEGFRNHMKTNPHAARRDVKKSEENYHPSFTPDMLKDGMIAVMYLYETRVPFFYLRGYFIPFDEQMKDKANPDRIVALYEYYPPYLARAFRDGKPDLANYGKLIWENTELTDNQEKVKQLQKEIRERQDRLRELKKKLSVFED